MYKPMSSIYILSRDQLLPYEQSDRIMFAKCRGRPLHYLTSGSQREGHPGRAVADRQDSQILPVRFQPRSSQPMFTVLADGTYDIELQIGVNTAEYPAFSAYISLDAVEDHLDRSGIILRRKVTTDDLHNDLLTRTFKTHVTVYMRSGDYLSVSISNKACTAITLLAGETYLLITKVNSYP